MVPLKRLSGFRRSREFCLFGIAVFAAPVLLCASSVRPSDAGPLRLAQASSPGAEIAAPKSTASDKIAVVISIVKADESVMKHGQTGESLALTTLRLTPPKKPDLPDEKKRKADTDTHYDKSPAQCTTGSDGKCTIEIAREDQPRLGLPSLPNVTSYTVALRVPKDDGDVVETTAARKPPKTPASTDKLHVEKEKFSIGERTFERLSYNISYALGAVPASIRESLGPKREIDRCRDKEPAAWLSLADAPVRSPQVQLPGAIVRLEKMN